MLDMDLLGIENAKWYIILLIATFAISMFFLYRLLDTNRTLAMHPMLATVYFKRLKAGSPTRKRLEKAAELFQVRGA